MLKTDVNMLFKGYFEKGLATGMSLLVVKYLSKTFKKIASGNMFNLLNDFRETELLRG